MPGFMITGGEKTPGPQSLAETARSHRWEVTIQGGTSSPGSISQRAASDELKFYASSVSRPSIEVDSITMHHRSNEIKLPGKSRSGTCSLTVYERISGQNIAAAVARQWWSQWLMDAKSYSLNMAGSTIMACKRDLHIALFDGCGTQTWGYLLKGVFPTKVTPSELDYSVSDLATTEITLSIDAFQEGQDI